MFSPPVKESVGNRRVQRAKAGAVAGAVPHLLDGSIFVDAHFCEGGGADGLSTRVHDLHHQPLLAGLPPKHSTRPFSCNLHWVSPTGWRDSPLTRPCSIFQRLVHLKSKCHHVPPTIQGKHLEVTLLNNVTDSDPCTDKIAKLH